MLSRDKLTTLVIISEPQGERYLTWRRLILTLKLQLESQHHCVSKRTEILRKQRNIMTHLVLKYTGLPLDLKVSKEKDQRNSFKNHPSFQCTNKISIRNSFKSNILLHWIWNERQIFVHIHITSRSVILLTITEEGYLI